MIINAFIALVSTLVVVLAGFVILFAWHSAGAMHFIFWMCVILSALAVGVYLQIKWNASEERRRKNMEAVLARHQ